MKINDSLDNGIVTIRLSGKLMGGDPATEFHGKVHEYLNLNKKQFIIDLKDVKWANSSGLGMLVAALTSISKADGQMVLANITNIENILTITHLVRVFECHDSIDEARSALSSPASS